MTTKRTIATCLHLIVYLLTVNLWAAESQKTIRHGDWKLVYQPDSKGIHYYHNGQLLLRNVYAKIKTGGKTITTKDLKLEKIRPYHVYDAIGKGKGYELTYSDTLARDLSLLQHIVFYDGEDYFLTDITARSSQQELRSNYMSPLCTETATTFLPPDSTNRMLRVPFDNDAFVRYLSLPLDSDMLSFEVTAIYNGTGRQGLVVGSVEHDTWKTGISVAGSRQQTVDQLECFGGVADLLTRDIGNRNDLPSCQHGAISGKQIRSPKILVGLFPDWRRGMETFGEVNAAIAPPRHWASGTPFGWNSWAALATKVNYDAATAVSDYIKQTLQPAGFENDGVTYIGLDSFWDNMNEEQLKAFVRHCQQNGQKAGIYWCPFSDWLGDGNRFVEGTNDRWRYKDIYLYAGGRPRKIESLAVDPTHPATKQRIRHYIRKFREWGYSYIKLDFINNGALEADRFYNPEVTTGMQAYNEGMQFLCDECGDDMFLALSIAPLFPAQYGTSRRISCDTWGAMNGEFGSTEYMLNSLSYGWWLDRVYPFNDADHILLYKPEESSAYHAGANRARITSAVITGLYMLGDDFSTPNNASDGDGARNRGEQFATNRDINDIARLGRSFYPVRGYAADGRVEECYMMETPEYIYVAVFNFGTTALNGNLTARELGIRRRKTLKGKELWTSEPFRLKGELSFSVPPQDARVYRVEL